MKVLFCNTTYMKWYRGILSSDKPENGGGYIKEHKDDPDGIADEDNFLAYNLGAPDKLSLVFPDGKNLDIPGKEFCLAYVSTKRRNGIENSLHIERIHGCEGCTNDDYVDEVLVVFTAKSKASDYPTIIGWFKHAYVFRNYANIPVAKDILLTKNIIARSEDVVLLPENERKWKACRAKADGFGFGQSNFWFADESQSPKVHDYVQDILRKIENYDGMNLMDYAECHNCGHIVPIKQKFCNECGYKMFFEATASSVDLFDIGPKLMLDIAMMFNKNPNNPSIQTLYTCISDANYMACSVSIGRGDEPLIDAAEAAMQSIKGINKSVDQVIVCIAATEALLDDASVESAIELLEKKCGSKEPVMYGTVIDNSLEDKVRLTLFEFEGE